MERINLCFFVASLFVHHRQSLLSFQLCGPLFRIVLVDFFLEISLFEGLVIVLLDGLGIQKIVALRIQSPKRMAFPTSEGRLDVVHIH